MTDVLDIARARIDALKAEIAQLEAFVRMGEKLSSDNRPVDIPSATAKVHETQPDPTRA